MCDLDQSALRDPAHLSPPRRREDHGAALFSWSPLTLISWLHQTASPKNDLIESINMRFLTSLHPLNIGLSSPRKGQNLRLLKVTCPLSRILRPPKGVLLSLVTRLTALHPIVQPSPPHANCPEPPTLGPEYQPPKRGLLYHLPQLLHGPPIVTLPAASEGVSQLPLRSPPFAASTTSLLTPKPLPLPRLPIRFTLPCLFRNRQDRRTRL